MSAASTAGWLRRSLISSTARGFVRRDMRLVRPALCRASRGAVIPPAGASCRDVGRERLCRLRREPNGASADLPEVDPRAPIGPGRRHDRVLAVRGLDPQRVGAVRAKDSHLLPVSRVDLQGEGHLRPSGSAHRRSLLGTLVAA